MERWNTQRLPQKLIDNNMLTWNSWQVYVNIGFNFYLLKRKQTQELFFKYKDYKEWCGTLTQYVGLRKINTRGIANATKVMLCAAMAYNLKKYLKFTRKKQVTGAGVLPHAFLQIMLTITSILSLNRSLKI